MSLKWVMGGKNDYQSIIEEFKILKSPDLKTKMFFFFMKLKFDEIIFFRENLCRLMHIKT